jgi:Ca-activated chloride channel family protein
LDKSDRQKILVLLTDGEDLEKGAIHTAETLAKQGVVVFTIGVGTPAGSELHFVNDQGRPDVVHDRSGNVVQSRLDEITLRAIALATKGAYYPLGPIGEGLAKIRLDIENLSLSSGTSARKLGVDRFHLPVSLVLALFVIESLIGTRRWLRESTA